MYMLDVFTLSANLAGIPGISVPCGFSKDNLPIGLQIMGKHFDEQVILKTAFNRWRDNTVDNVNKPAKFTSPIQFEEIYNNNYFSSSGRRNIPFKSYKSTIYEKPKFSVQLPEG